MKIFLDKWSLHNRLLMDSGIISSFILFSLAVIVICGGGIIMIKISNASDAKRYKNFKFEKTVVPLRYKYISTHQAYLEIDTAFISRTNELYLIETDDGILIMKTRIYKGSYLFFLRYENIYCINHFKNGNIRSHLSIFHNYSEIPNPFKVAISKSIDDRMSTILDKICNDYRKSISAVFYWT